MRYIQPRITGTFPAVSTIQTEKNALVNEGSSDIPQTTSAYQADE